MEKIAYWHYDLQCMWPLSQISKHTSAYALQEAQFGGSGRNTESKTKPLTFHISKSTASAIAYTVSYA